MLAPILTSRAVAPWPECDEALRLDPKDPVVHLIRGILRANKGEIGPGLSEVIFHPLIRTDPGRYKLLAALYQ